MIFLYLVESFELLRLDIKRYKGWMVGRGRKNMQN